MSYRIHQVLTGMILVFTVTIIGVGWPAETRAVEYRADVHQEVESLTDGRDDWRSTGARLTLLDEASRQYWGSFRRTNRFDEDDSEWGLGTYQPLSERWALSFQGLYSNTHEVLPEWDLSTELHWEAVDGTFLHAGWGIREFTDVTENGNGDEFDAEVLMPSVGIEQYWQNFRAGYTFRRSILEQSTYASTHVFDFEVYGDPYEVEWFDSLLLRGWTGDDIDSLNADTVEKIPSDGVMARMRFRLDPAWTLSLSGHYARLDHGDSYSRRGIRFGLIRTF